MTENKYFRVIRQAKPGKNWANNTDGRFIDIDDDGRYRFVPSTIGDWWDQDLSVITTRFYDLEDDEQYTSIIRKLPVVAWGLLPQYIRWEAEKSLGDIFSVYYGQCFEAWKSNKRFDIELMAKSDKEIEAAYIEAMIADESYRIEESSKRLFPYLYDEEQQILKQVGDSFIKYLRDRLNELKPTQTQNRKTRSNDELIAIIQTPLQKAIDNKIVVFNGQSYQWLGTKKQLLRFAVRASNKYNIKGGKWRPFENLFGVTRLAQDFADLKAYVESFNDDKDFDPTDWVNDIDSIDSLFE